jgi:hypothetical protein
VRHDLASEACPPGAPFVNKSVGSTTVGRTTNANWTILLKQARWTWFCAFHLTLVFDQTGLFREVLE